MRPATTATIVPAAKAFCMKWNWRSCCPSLQMSNDACGGLPNSAIDMKGCRLRLAHNDKAAVSGAEDLDRRAVEARQGLAGDDVARRTDRGAPVGDIDDRIQVGDERVDVVDDEEDRNPLGAADVLHQRGDRLLVADVE